MLEEFDRTRREFVKEREVEQRAADSMCREMYERIGSMLQKEGKEEKHPMKAIISLLRQDGVYSQNALMFDEVYGYWTLSRDVDFDGERHGVTITAYGDKDPNRATRSFVQIDGISHFIEVKKDRGVMWEQEKRGKRTHNVRKQRANIVEASFFEDVLNRFQAQVAKPE